MKFGAGKFNWEENSYPFEEAYLSQTTAEKSLLGLPQSNVPEWRDRIYSSKCTKYLYEYSRQLDCVEVSSTFYTDVSGLTLKKWMRSVLRTGLTG